MLKKAFFDTLQNWESDFQNRKWYQMLYFRDSTKRIN